MSKRYIEDGDTIIANGVLLEARDSDYLDQMEFDIPGDGTMLENADFYYWDEEEGEQYPISYDDNNRAYVEMED